MIIQGSNDAIVLSFEIDVSHAQAIEIILYNEKKILKRWNKDTVEVRENMLLLPLTENETLTFPAGKAWLEIKWQDEAGMNNFADIIETFVEYRRNKKAMR